MRRTAAGGSAPRGTRGLPPRWLPPFREDARWSRLDGAFALAAHDLVRLVALPVDEVLHVLEVEFDRQREVLRARLELDHADASDERVELLALVALGLVVADPALDRLRHALGRQTHL